jgi:hypothetical protein
LAPYQSSLDAHNQREPMMLFIVGDEGDPFIRVLNVGFQHGAIPIEHA